MCFSFVNIQELDKRTGGVYKTWTTKTGTVSIEIDQDSKYPTLLLPQKPKTLEIEVKDCNIKVYSKFTHEGKATLRLMSPLRLQVTPNSPNNPNNPNIPNKPKNSSLY